MDRLGSDIPKRVNLGEYAHLCGLDRVVPGRFSWFFVVQLFVHAELSGVDPTTVVNEIRDLESGWSRLGTKPASEFTRAPLKGLWKKHFFSARYLAKNLLNQLSRECRHELVADAFGPEGSIITADKIRDLAERVTVGTLERRAAQNKLTGEWIVFAKYGDRNYYLCLATHDAGDEAIHHDVMRCAGEFPFLSLWS